MDKNIKLTKNELEIMNILWSEKKALSRSDIINLSKERSWKASSIHILLNQLLEKEAICVDGFVKTGKNYGRTFSPCFTEEEYYVMQFKNSNSYKNSKLSSLINFVSSLVNTEDIDNETINTLEKILDDKRRELK